jgi:hypothetical protein
LKLKINLIFIIIIIFFACDVAEDLVTDRKAPNVGPIQSNVGFDNVNPGDTLELSVSATNPEDGDLSYEWSANGGNIIGSINEIIIRWRSPLNGGTFRISVKVSNDYKNTTKFVDIEVWSPFNPYVNINFPTDGSYLIQHTHTDLNFDAVHNNNIALIYIYINDQIVDSMDGLQQSNYVYEKWNVDNPAGDTKIKVEAISTNYLFGSDSINVIIEGIIPGKTGI